MSFGMESMSGQTTTVPTRACSCNISVSVLAIDSLGAHECLLRNTAGPSRHVKPSPECMSVIHAWDMAALQNRTYDRWWQARSAFGGIGGGLVNIVRQVWCYWG